MTKAIVISLVVVVILGAALCLPPIILPKLITQAATDASGDYFFSSIIESTYTAVENDVITSYLYPARLRARIDVEDFSQLWLSVIFYSGTFSVDIGGEKLILIESSLATYNINITASQGNVTLSIGDRQLSILAAAGVQVNMSFVGDACRIASRGSEVDSTNVNKGGSVNATYTQAIGLLGYGVLVDDNYAAIFLECGDFYSAVILQNYDIKFLAYRVTCSRAESMTVSDGKFSLADFGVQYKLLIITEPSDNAAIAGDNALTMTQYGRYVFSLDDSYCKVIYTIDYIKEDSGGSGEDSGGSGEDSGGSGEDSGGSGEDSGGSGEDSGGSGEDSGGSDEDSGGSGGENEGGGVDVIVKKLDWGKVGGVAAGGVILIVSVAMLFVWLFKKKK